jgi:hypothetical protein
MNHEDIVGTHKLIVVDTWNDHFVTREVQGHCMMMPAPGLWYHVRLNTFFIIKKDLPASLGGYA